VGRPPAAPGFRAPGSGDTLRMTNVTETVRQTPAIHSTNGGPPAAANGAMVAIAAAAAFLTGVAVARWLDWRTHAHPHH
jgi:hypothetical protein